MKFVGTVGPEMEGLRSPGALLDFILSAAGDIGGCDLVHFCIFNYACGCEMLAAWTEGLDSSYVHVLEMWAGVVRGRKNQG